MRNRSISTLDVHRVLETLGVKMAKRTLQYHLDSNLLTCKDGRVVSVITKMISSYDSLMKDLKEEFLG